MSDARLVVLDQLDQLEEVFLEGTRIPFSGGRLVNEHDAVELLDAIRVALPQEIEIAAELVKKGLDRRRRPARPRNRASTTCKRSTMEATAVRSHQ